jgi:hypothetical protein
MNLRNKWVGDQCTKFIKVRRRTIGKLSKKGWMNTIDVLNKMNFYFIACCLKKTLVLLFVDN